MDLSLLRCIQTLELGYLCRLHLTALSNPCFRLKVLDFIVLDGNLCMQHIELFANVLVPGFQLRELLVVLEILWKQGLVRFNLRFYDIMQSIDLA